MLHVCLHFQYNWFKHDYLLRLKNVQSNMETAIEFAPESFAQVHMLYIDCKVNGHPVKAFVDSGEEPLPRVLTV